MNTLEKVKEFYEKEFQSDKRYLNSKCFADKKTYVYGSIQYFLGVSMFVQTLGVKFEDIEPIYNSYKEKLENLLT